MHITPAANSHLALGIVFTQSLSPISDPLHSTWLRKIGILSARLKFPLAIASVTNECLKLNLMFHMRVQLLYSSVEIHSIPGN